MKRCEFFRNEECEYFPCHAVTDASRFNCLFCYCPLYFLGEDCGGDFRMTESGLKDCSDCLYPHLPENCPFILERLRALYREAGNGTGPGER